MELNRSKEWWMNRIKDEPDGPIGAHGGAFCARETLRSRMWRWMGFCWPYDPALSDWRNMEPPQDGYAPGAFITETHITISFGDRLRILLTGHVAVEVSTKADVIPKRLTSRSRVAVLPPIKKTDIQQDQ